MKSQIVKVATSHEDLKRKLLYFAICSRIFVLLLSVISNTILPDHDAGVFIFPQPLVNRSSSDEIVEKVLGGLVRWDAQYFLHIAHHGYTYENTLAFFPLFPFCIRSLSQLLDISIGNFINPISKMLLSAILINLFFFVSAAMKLFELSYKILQDDKLAYMSVVFFCINPASIFFTAPYSESCYSFLVFSGMLYSIEKDRELLSTFAFALSGCVRSNGLLNFGYIVHKMLKNIFSYIQSIKGKISVSVFYHVYLQFYKLFIYVTICVVPFLLYQTYVYNKFCFAESDMSDILKQFGKKKGFILPGSKKSPWCNFTIPFSYSYVQNHYWDVGLFRYYQLKQIPNFLLAMPVIYLMLTNTYRFILENKSHMFSAGLKSSNHVRFENKVLKPEFFVYAVHALFLTVFCTLFVHIQVTTRMIASSCPILYWYVALQYQTEKPISEQALASRLRNLSNPKYSLVETEKNMNSVWRTFILTEKPLDKRSLYIKLYFFLYLTVGTVLFSNFLPWT